MGLRRFIKKARKTLGLPAITLGNVAKVGAAAASGGLGGAAMALGGAALRSKLKNAAIGGVKQVLRTKAQRALARRIHVTAPRVVPISAATVKPPAETLPGGAPLQGRAPARRGAVTAPRTRRRKAAAAPRAPKAPRAKGTRKPPKGGLDLKALSASWKAAGKPGTWQAWIASHK